ncbi:MAG: YigZ family protein [Bacteroidales bacterium]|nr:YigZ family protein [Bacteroidales bacterium]MBN2758039.1 YigZ family protein [Bacteroidales bacterium]
MSEEDIYKTISKPSEGFYKDKGSKFYSYSFPVQTDEEIQQYRSQIRKKHHDARHHVYAYRIGAEKDIFYSSDDGEPANSSGPPVLGQIRAADLTNILIIVVRYFGGTKLGIPGLIKAYKSAALKAIQNSNVITKTIGIKIKLSFNYPLMNDVMRVLKDDGIEIINQNFTDNCFIEIKIRKNIYEQTINKLNLMHSLNIKTDTN